MKWSLVDKSSYFKEHDAFIETMGLGGDDDIYSPLGLHGIGSQRRRAWPMPFLSM